MYVREADLSDLGHERSEEFRRLCYNLTVERANKGITPDLQLKSLRVSRDKWNLIVREGPEAVAIGADVCGLCSLYLSAGHSWCGQCPLKLTVGTCSSDQHPYTLFFHAETREETIKYAQKILDLMDYAIYELKSENPELV